MEQQSASQALWELYQISSWWELLFIGSIVLLIITQIWDKVVCKGKSGFLIDSVISTSIGLFILFLVWRDWVKSIFVGCALILLSSAWKDFQIFVMRKITNYSRKNVVKSYKYDDDVKQRKTFSTYRNNSFKNRHLKQFPFCVKRKGW